MSGLKKLVIALILISTLGQSRAGLKTKLGARNQKNEKELIEVFSPKLKCPPETGPQFLTCAKDVFANVSDDDEEAKYDAAVCRFLDDIDLCYVIGFANCTSPNVSKEQKEYLTTFQESFMNLFKVDCSRIAKSNSKQNQSEMTNTTGLSTRYDGSSNEFEARDKANPDNTQVLTINSKETFPNNSTEHNFGSISGTEIIKIKYSAVSLRLVVAFIIFHWFQF